MVLSVLLIRSEQNGHLARIEVDAMFGFMCHSIAEVSPRDAVPGGVVLNVKLLNMAQYPSLRYISAVPVPSRTYLHF